MNRFQALKIENSQKFLKFFQKSLIQKLKTCAHPRIQKLNKSAGSCDDWPVQQRDFKNGTLKNKRFDRFFEINNFRVNDLKAIVF